MLQRRQPQDPVFCGRQRLVPVVTPEVLCALMCCSAGSPKARVFPLPVAAMPTRSWPELMMGQHWAWMGEGSTKSLIACKSSPAKPAGTFRSCSVLTQMLHRVPGYVQQLTGKPCKLHKRSSALRAGVHKIACLRAAARQQSLQASLKLFSIDEAAPHDP